MKPTLVIMAAGMASRYGSMKQIQQFGPGGETIMDYSIYDAINAGFDKVVFVIRKDFAEDFCILNFLFYMIIILEAMQKRRWN
jgi:CTP:molybdopterin cytidylyltransferase MocA